MYVCMCAACVPGACEGQKATSGPQELELRIVSQPWVLGIRLRSSVRATGVPSC